MKDYLAEVISNKKITPDGMEITVMIDSPPVVRGGQFAMLKVINRPDLILRRPLGIVKAEEGTFTFIYQIKGGGTKALAQLNGGDKINVTLPLGKPFDTSGARSVVIIGGGYGTMPLLLAASDIKNAQKYIYTGFSTKAAVMLEKEFDAAGRHTVCTDDGSCGFKGFPTTALEMDIDKIKPDVILCCGPDPLMRAVKRLGESRGIKTLLSLEQRMGCGVGACLVCTCKVSGKNTRVCADGPVFDSREVFE